MIIDPTWVINIEDSKEVFYEISRDWERILGIFMMGVSNRTQGIIRWWWIEVTMHMIHACYNRKRGETRYFWSSWNDGAKSYHWLNNRLWYFLCVASIKQRANAVVYLTQWFSGQRNQLLEKGNNSKSYLIGLHIYGGNVIKRCSRDLTEKMFLLGLRWKSSYTTDFSRWIIGNSCGFVSTNFSKVMGC